MKIDTENKTMSLKKIIKGLKDGTITILDGGHVCNSVVDKLENNLGHINDAFKKHKDIIKNAKSSKEEVDKSKRMIEFYNYKVNIEFGKFIDGEQYCFNCGAYMYILLLDEKTIGYIPTTKFWKISEDSGRMYDYKAKKEDCKCCSAKPLVDAGMLTAEIEAPTGELIFQNYFSNEKMYEYQGDEDDSINSIEGRNILMQDLATRNVGYGQMGNMGVTVYSNDKDEIIIGSDLECYEDNKAYHEEKGGEITEDWKEEVEQAESFKKILSDGKFKEVGYLSLGVWRWMCADAKTLKKYKEKKGEDALVAKLAPGKYKIEHYYDFPKNGNYLYSRIKLKS